MPEFETFESVERRVSALERRLVALEMVLEVVELPSRDHQLRADTFGKRLMDATAHNEITWKIQVRGRVVGILPYESEYPVLVVPDPYLLFYLRWSGILEKEADGTKATVRLREPANRMAVPALAKVPARVNIRLPAFHQHVA